MSHQTIRVNISSVIFPFTKDLWGESVIVPQYDENYERGLPFGDTDLGKEKGIAMACYLHNVMPTTEGYQSIGFQTNIPGDGVSTDFDRVFPLLQSSPNDAHFLFSPSNGKNRIYDATVGDLWTSVSPLPMGTIADNTTVTTAFIQGQTYIYYGGNGCYVYDQVNKVMVLTALGGLTASAILGITASFGYMIAFSSTAVAWSNATNPVDFVPSLATGAGGGNVNDIKGNIICCVPVSGGFLVFCEKNVVAAKYTGNIRFPFVFKEIPGSGGIASFDKIAIGDNLGEVYAFTTSGLQVFTLSTVDNVFPEVTDFLSKLIFEDFDDTVLVFTEQYLSTALNVKITAVSDRFVTISYGVSSPDFTHAVLYDRFLKRWGKVKITHRACFQWNAPNLFGNVTYGQLGAIGITYGGLAGITYGDLSTSVNTPEQSLKTISFVQGDGTVKDIVFDLAQTIAVGTFFIGKFKMTRNKFITHQWSDIENVPLGQPFKAYLFPTLDGKTFLTPVPLTQIKNLNPGQNTGLVQRWAGRVTGQNYTLMMQGAFNLTSILTDFTLAGDR